MIKYECRNTEPKDSEAQTVMPKGIPTEPPVYLKIFFFSLLSPISQIHSPVLDGLGDMLGLDILAAVQVGDCSGYL